MSIVQESRHTRNSGRRIPNFAQADAGRRHWVSNWLRGNGLPAIKTGSYYVKSFRTAGAIPAGLEPLHRGSIVRLCFKPPIL
jgi:hypothetical protein